MKWPWSSDDNNDNRKPPPSIFSVEFWSDPQTFLHPKVLIPAAILATGSLTLGHIYGTYMRRIPESSQIYPSFFRRRSLYGKVTSVGDADNFRLYHTPGGILLGWEWFPRRKVPTDPKELRQRTLHIRIAGVDAPELGHWGNPTQPHGQESLEWLRNYILGKKLRAYIYRRDQYDRIVGTVKIWKGLRRKDLGLEMLRAGMAVVYEAKTGAEFGGMEEKYRFAEFKARSQKKGIWGMKGIYESPGAYKRAIREEAAVAASAAANVARTSSGGSGTTKSGGKGSTSATPIPPKKKG